MSHEFESGMFVKQPAWHKLGNVIQKAPETSKEAIVEAGLNWDVEKREVYWKTPDTGEFYRIPNNVSLVRTSDQKPLSIVSDHYNVLQNSEAFEFFDPIVKSGKATYETAGSLCGGKVIWVLANINRTVEIVKGDATRRYLVLTNSHGFNRSIQILTSNIRIVCMNTLNLALASGGSFGIRHQGGMKQEMERVKGLLGFAEQQCEQTEEIYKAMANYPMNNTKTSEYIMSVIPPANEEATDRVKATLQAEQEKIWELMETGVGTDIKGVKGTLWNSYNAFTEYVDYYASPRTRDRTNYLLFGTGRDMKKRAYDKAVEMVEA